MLFILNYSNGLTCLPTFYNSLNYSSVQVSISHKFPRPIAVYTIYAKSLVERINRLVCFIPVVSVGGEQ